MKKSLILIWGVLFIMLLSLPVWATAAAPDKIGFIDVRKVMLDSDLGKKASAEMQESYQKNNALLQEKKTEIDKLKDEIDKTRKTLSETALRDKEASLDRKMRDYQVTLNDMNEALKAKDMELVKSIVPEITKIVKAIGEKEKYTVILDAAYNVVAYWSKDRDLTKRVLEEFNKTHKVENK